MKMNVKLLLALLVFIVFCESSLSKINRRFRRRMLSENSYLKNKFLRKFHSKMHSHTAHKKVSAQFQDINKEEVAELENPQIKAMLNMKVLIDIQIIVLSNDIGTKGENICSIGYELVEDKMLGKVVDLNKGAMGEYIYMCALYRSYYNMNAEEKPINTLAIQIGNSNCGSLKGDEIDLNTGAGGKYIYLCRGHVKYDTETHEGKEAIQPIKKLMTWTNGSAMSKFSFTHTVDKKLTNFKCLGTDLNKGAGGQYIYLCYAKEANAPMKIEYSNMLIDSANEAGARTNETFATEDFKLDNGDAGASLVVSQERQTTVSNETSKQVIHSGGFGVNVGLSFQLGVGPIKINNFKSSIETTLNWSGSNIQSQMNSQTSAYKFDCVVPPGKFYKCLKEKKTTNMSYTYYFNKKYTDFSGRSFTVKGKGLSSMSGRSELTGRSCCYNMCEQTDTLCEGALMKSSATTSTCPNFVQKPVKRELRASKTNFTFEDFGLEDAEVIIDISVFFGKADTAIKCPQGYTLDPTDIRKENYTGDSVFICFLKTRLSSIPFGKTVINTIRVQYYNKECGYLSLVKNDKEESDVNQSKSNPIYICFGYDAQSTSYPITNIAITKEVTVTASTNKKLELELLKQKLGNANGIIITRQNNIPQRVEVSNYMINSYEAVDIEVPSRIDTIFSSGTTVKKTVTTVDSTETTRTATFNFGISVGVNLTLAGADIPFELTAGLSANYSYNKSESTTSTNEEKEIQEVTCTGLPGKDTRCIITKNTKSLIISYSYTQDIYGYDGKKLTSTPINSTYETKKSKSISVVTCCAKGCCTGDPNVDKKLPQCVLGNGTTYRPKDFTCSEYESCLSAAENEFKLSPLSPVSIILKTVSKATRRYFR